MLSAGADLGNSEIFGLCSNWGKPTPRRRRLLGPDVNPIQSVKMKLSRGMRWTLAPVGDCNIRYDVASALRVIAIAEIALVR